MWSFCGVIFIRFVCSFRVRLIIGVLFVVVIREVIGFLLLVLDY